MKRTIAAGRRELWFRQVVLGPLVHRMGPLLGALAFVWRRMMLRTTFIAITGSLGKTTAKECLGEILASYQPTFRTYRNHNSRRGVALNVLRVRPWHRFAVIEAAAGGPNSMWRSATVLRPDIAIILTVCRTHTTQYKDLDEHAAEKAVLARAVKPSGTVLLNMDDPRVAAMSEQVRASVRYFGTKSSADYRAENVRSRWPERLQFLVHGPRETVDVKTQLVGTHWLPSVLGALAAAETAGMTLTRAAKVLGRVPPFPGRLQPVRVPSGAIFVRDDYNASLVSTEASLRTLEEASSCRRWIVLTDISDFGAKRRRRLKYLGPESHRVADAVVFVGQDAAYGKRRAIEAGMAPENAHAFSKIEEAANFLRTALAKDDLVLLKGRTTDHAARIFLAQLGPVGCWKEYCPKRMLCDICWELDLSREQMEHATVVEWSGATG